MDAIAKPGEFSRFEQLRYARDILRIEGEALLGLASRLADDFCAATDLLHSCRGNIIVTGMGKAGLVGQKIAATLASTGTRSHFLHPGEAVHGDLGRIGEQDVLLALSFSGETEEVVRLLPHIHAIQTPIVAVTGKPTSTLARSASMALLLGSIREACYLGLAPSTSTTAMLAMGDALALVVCRRRQFRRQDFAQFHPGGSLGRKLASVDEVMRPLAECRLARQDQSIRDVLVQAGRPGRRTGAIMLEDGNGRLVGVFTDSDLARLLEDDTEGVLDTPVREAMTAEPRSILSGARLGDALFVLAEHKISELPVVDAEDRPLGLVDITDVVSLLPPPDQQSDQARSGDGSGGGRDTLPFPHK